MLQFWFEFASTYSYLSAMRIATLAEHAGVAVRWQPFLLGPIFGAKGWNDSPFNVYPDKGRYMWRDLERQAARYELPFRRPSQFPRNSLLAARAAIVARDQGWIAQFAPAVFHANFVDDANIADRAVLTALIDGLKRNGSAVLEEAQSDAVKAGLRDAVAAAQDAHIFGAPTFTVGNELFWGDDRLDQALQAARVAA